MTKYLIDGKTINQIIDLLNVGKIGYPLNKTEIKNVLNELDNLPTVKEKE